VWQPEHYCFASAKTFKRFGKALEVEHICEEIKKEKKWSAPATPLCSGKINHIRA
jgi:hypothetical protein